MLHIKSVIFPIFLLFVLTNCTQTSSKSEKEEEMALPVSAIELVAKSNSTEKVKVVLDNASKKPIALKFENQIDTISSAQSKEVVLSKGIYEYRQNKEVKGEFELSSEGILNLSRGMYVRWRDVYAKRDVELPSEVLREDSIYIQNEKYYGDLKRYDERDFFLPKTWDLGLSESFPDTVNMQGKEYVIKTKIFRAADFQQHYSELMEIDKALFDSLLNQVLEK